MLEYSGTANDELLTEIQVRGGMDAFLKKIEVNKLRDKEIEKLSNEIYSLCRNTTTVELINSKLSSEILSKTELSELIISRYNSYQSNIHNISITNYTVIRCFIGGVLAIFTGSIIWGYSIFYFHSANYIVLSVLSVILFLIVQLVSGKSSKNTLVFTTAFISIIASFFIGFYISSILPPLASVLPKEIHMYLLI
jgi:hypothetical protein